MLLKQCREPQTHTVDLETQQRTHWFSCHTKRQKGINAWKALIDTIILFYVLIKAWKYESTTKYIKLNAPWFTDRVCVCVCACVSPETSYWACKLWNCWKWAGHLCRAQWETGTFPLLACWERCQSPLATRLFAGSPGRSRGKLGHFNYKRFEQNKEQRRGREGTDVRDLGDLGWVDWKKLKQQKNSTLPLLTRELKPDETGSLFTLFLLHNFSISFGLHFRCWMERPVLQTKQSLHFEYHSLCNWIVASCATDWLYSGIQGPPKN